MASGFFCVTGSRHLELGLEVGAHNRVERVVVDVQVIGLLDPLPQRVIRGKAAGLPERLLQGGRDA
jgi:hypothetical protein